MKFPDNLEIKEWVSNNFDTHIISSKKLAGEVDLNYYLAEENGSEYILKIASQDSSQENLEMQSAMLQHLETSAPYINLPRLIPNNQGQLIGTFPLSENETRKVRLLSWVPGKLWADMHPHTDLLRESLGKICGQLPCAPRL